MDRPSLILAACALAALPLAAAPAAAKDTSPAPASASAEGSKRICRIQPSTGWRTRATRICRTRTEWEQLARQNDEDMRELRRRRAAASQ